MPRTKKRNSRSRRAPSSSVIGKTSTSIFFSPSLNALTGWLSGCCGLWRETCSGEDAAVGRFLEESGWRKSGDGIFVVL